MSSRNARNSYRIACRIVKQEARPSVSGQAEVKKLFTDQTSQPAVAANPIENFNQKHQVSTQLEETPNEMDTRRLH